MLCERALALLRDLTERRLEASAGELDELLRAGLLVEHDPQAIWLLQELARLAAEQPAPFSFQTWPPAAALAAAGEALSALEQDLRSDWYRIKASTAVLREQEQRRLDLRRVLGVLSEPAAASSLEVTVAAQSRCPKDAVMVPCPAVGSGLFALTNQGARVLAELTARSDERREATLGALLARLDKRDAKIGVFRGQLDDLSMRVGALRRGKGRVLVGLIKAGLPLDQVADLYQRVQPSAGSDVAVICARSLATVGDPAKVQSKLEAACDALIRAGCARSPALRGAAKSLLPYEPLEAGVARFVALCGELRALIVVGDDRVRFAARLMPAPGTPAELGRRVRRATQQLTASHAVRRRTDDVGMASVALAALAPADEAVDPLCERFLALERALVDVGLHGSATAEDDALACVSCPGSPAAVAVLVREVFERVPDSVGNHSDRTAVAASFAKRFAS